MSKTIRTIDSTPTDMFERDAIKRFIEGLKVSISCCKEMEMHEPKMGWKAVTTGLEAMLVSGTKLARAKAITRQQLLADADVVQRKLDTSAKP